MKPSIFLFLAVLFAGCGQPKETLNILISPEWLDPKIVKAFEAQFHCQVTVDFCDDPEAVETKLANGGDALFDVVFPFYNSMPLLIERGLLAPLRREKLSNFANIDPLFLNTRFDPGNGFTVPYQWGILGLLARQTEAGARDESWGLVFDPAKQPGPFVLFDAAGGCLAAGLRFKGYDPNSLNADQLREVRDLMVTVSRRVLAFDNPLGCRNRVLAKEAVLAMVSNVDGIIAMREDPETRFFLPREGSEMWFDSMAIPARAPHRELAEKFINFVLDAKIGAQLANFNHAATPNRAAQEFLDPTERENPALYPPSEVMKHLWQVNNSSEQRKLYDELWTQIKTR